MKTAKQIKDLIRDANAWDELEDLVNEGRYNEIKVPFLDMEFCTFEDAERDNESLYMRFSLDGVIFEVETEYNSWDTVKFDSYEVKEMYPVRKATRTIDVWERINE